jgi:DDE superfamily endonuclease
MAKALAALSSTDQCHGLIREVAGEFGVSESSLSKAWTKLKQARADCERENNPIVLARAARLIEPRGSSTHRLLTDEEEANVVRRLKVQHPNGFTDRIILQTCVQVARNLRAHPRKWSKSFLTRFKHRAGISRAKFILRKRNIEDPAATFEQDIEAACEYLEQVEQLTQSIPIERIINVDETPSYVRNAPSHALHFIDSPLPWAWTRTQERDKVTVIAACTGEGSMLKSAIIAKGKTTRCEREYVSQIGDLSYVQHTVSGITNTHSFIDYIKAVITPYTGDNPSALIVDSWGAHLTPPVRDYCASHNITLVRVPDRATSTLQPLDVGVFAVAKDVIYADAKESFFELIRPEEDRWHATAACVEALRNVSCRAVRRGWIQVFPFWKEFLAQNNIVNGDEIE